VHPVAAWYTRRRSMRVMLVSGYVAIGFAATLTVLSFGL
jgi:hypothetical protein